MEFTVEGGRPDTLDPQKLCVIKDGGATRISINPQTMSDKVLEAVGRRHTARQTVEAYEQAVQAGFDDINMDLIAGLPADDAASFADSIRQVLDLNPSNITVHTLAVFPVPPAVRGGGGSGPAAAPAGGKSGSAL